MTDGRDPQALRRLFYAGKHQEVLSRTLDSHDGQVSAAQTAYVVGSLALLGRVDEALACVEAAASSRAIEAPHAIEARFFLVVGLCHAGRYAEAESWAVRNLRHLHDCDAKSSFFLFQGAALVRYFAGRVRRALFWTKRALAASVAARFNYGRLLALDLWGHILIQLGEVSSGLRTLGQAERLAAGLSYDGHATSIACSRLVYQSRHGRGGTDLEEALTTVAVASTDNIYALRAAWLELAFRAAIHGDAARARESLERAAAQAVPEHDERARTRLPATAAIIRRIDHSIAEAASCIVEADRAAERARDRVLRAEVRCWDCVLGTHALSLDPREARALSRETDSFAARCLEALHEHASLENLAAQDSPLWSLLLRKDSRPGERARLALRHGWLGLAVILLGAEPGRRIWLLESSFLADDQGTVVHMAKAPGHALELLRALGEGEQSKASLIQRIWHVANYSPTHHDAVIYTAVARMRRALGPSAEWVRTSPLGYALATGVVVADIDVEPPDTQAASFETASSVASSSSAPSASPVLSIERVLAGGAAMSSSELAQATGVSEATVLRRLRQLAADGLVLRSGAGKNTRYALTYGELRSN
jgi:DNA-binding transcriptional ArsR family regulator